MGKGVVGQAPWSRGQGFAFTLWRPRCDLMCTGSSAASLGGVRSGVLAGGPDTR